MLLFSCMTLRMLPHFKTSAVGYKVCLFPRFTLSPLTVSQELKKNCSPDLIIYIVGAKADLHSRRQVTSDFARLSLHNWFPPPKPLPPPPPPPPPSTLSYIRPRLTSFPGLRSHSAPSSPPVSPESPAYLDLPASRASVLQRSKTNVQSRPRTANSLTRSNTSSGSRTPQSSRLGSHFGFGGGWDAQGDNSSNSIEEEDEYAVDADSEEQEWGLSKGMELFEVSAKDNMGTGTFPKLLIDVPS